MEKDRTGAGGNGGEKAAEDMEEEEEGKEMAVQVEKEMERKKKELETEKRGRSWRRKRRRERRKAWRKGRRAGNRWLAWEEASVPELGETGEPQPQVLHCVCSHTMWAEMARGQRKMACDHDRDRMRITLGGDPGQL